MTLVLDSLEETDSDAKAAERRRGLRIRQARPVRVFEPAIAHSCIGRTEDISATGLRIELPASAALEAGMTINVHVGINCNGSTLANRRQMMSARVVWIEHRFESGCVTAGVEFLASIAAHLDAA